MPTYRTILGIDPGIAITGYGLLQTEQDNTDYRVLEYGVIRTPANTPTPVRLSELYGKLQTLINKYKPVVAGCEKVFFSKNVKTATEVAHARGVILLALDRHGINLIELTPPQIKNTITGYGSAEKKQVQYMTQQILKLAETPTQDDAADALAIAIAAGNLSLNNQL